MRYFDNCAATVMDESVIKEMEKAYRDEFYNPSSLYSASSEIKIKMNCARQNVADALMCEKDDIIFTGSGTEANNLAVLGGLTSKKGVIIASHAEHPSVFNTVTELKKRGFDVVFAPLNPDGSVNAEQFEELVCENAVMVALMHVNNETGGITDIKKLCKIVKVKNPSCVFVCDGVQAYGKIPTNMKDLDVDFYAISAHKIHGPKGIGALYVKKNAKISPIFFGGGQEKGLRPGTENVAAIYGFGVAAKTASKLLKENTAKFLEYQKTILDYLNENITDYFKISGDNSSPAILTLAFADIKSQILMHMLEKKGIYIGNGSACSSKSVYSRVATAVNLPKEFLEGIARICFCKYNSQSEVIELAEKLTETVKEIRNITKGRF